MKTFWRGFFKGFVSTILNLICLVIILFLFLSTPIRWFLVVLMGIVDTAPLKDTYVYRVSVEIYSRVEDWFTELRRKIL